MKLISAIIIAASLALFFIISVSNPFYISSYSFRLFLFISLAGLLLGLCVLPWLKGSFSEKWSSALKYGLLTAFTSFDTGFLLFSLSILI